MFEIKFDSRMNITERLLFGILEELREIKEKLNIPNIQNTATTEKSSVVEKEKPIENQNPSNKVGFFMCKFCGGKHENKGQILACAKKSKKKG